MPKQIIIIGAGASGLMAARTLCEQGYKPLILESRDRIGGRINSINSSDQILMENGAEFIHGELELTMELVKEAGLTIEKVEGEFWTVRNGVWDKEMPIDYSLLNKKLKHVERDMTVNEFLEQEFSGEKYQELRESLRDYVEGYDSGDPDKVSIIAFREEWENEDYSQFRIKEGYSSLLDYLLDRCLSAGAELRLSETVTDIDWQHNNATVVTNKNTYQCNQVILAIPLSLIQEKTGKGSIRFNPSISSKEEAAQKLGFGHAIKIHIQFTDSFWTSVSDKVSFIFSDQEIPTYWTQLPTKNFILTCWIAGPGAHKLKDVAYEEIFQKCIHSLSNIFRIKEENLNSKVLRYSVNNWVSDPLTRGAYAYSTINADKWRDVLMKPVEETIFFTGEAMQHGAQMGTVEAAFISGKRVAGEIIGINAIHFSR